jgi:hypothetical protein
MLVRVPPSLPAHRRVSLRLRARVPRLWSPPPLVTPSPTRPAANRPHNDTPSAAGSCVPYAPEGVSRKVVASPAGASHRYAEGKQG